MYDRMDAIFSKDKIVHQPIVLTFKCWTSVISPENVSMSVRFVLENKRDPYTYAFLLHMFLVRIMSPMQCWKSYSKPVIYTLLPAKSNLLLITLLITFLQKCLKIEDRDAT